MMLFLLNDVVLDLGDRELQARVSGPRFRALDMAFVERLGRELYAEAPLLQHAHPERARRLAALIHAKAPSEVNAALFVAPAQGCAPDEVTVRLTALDAPTMAAVYGRHLKGDLTALTADRQVWKRFAA